VWADTVLAAEQAHALRLLLWGGLSIVAATATAVMLVVRRLRSSLLEQFAIQMAAWGIAIAAAALLAFETAHLRDISGAARLERLLWMRIGLDVGVVAVGATVAVTGRMLARKLGTIGAGMAIVVQGVALLVIDLQFAATVSR
jgi:hypothetical protein